jgi:hypothetical protein
MSKYADMPDEELINLKRQMNQYFSPDSPSCPWATRRINAELRRRKKARESLPLKMTIGALLTADRPSGCQ